MEDSTMAESVSEGCRYGWYHSRREIECNSPSRKDGIDLKKETQLRLAYCSFIKLLGMKFRMRQTSIATATIFCHRFYFRQSFAKNDWQTIASACVFLASKVEDSPISLEKVVIVSYEMIHGGERAASQRIRQRENLERRKTLILLSEGVLMATMGFDFNVEHPYIPLSKVMHKLGISQPEICQRAWNFINDWLQTTLCLQYKPHYIAAGTLFITAQIFKVKLPTNMTYSWWHEFDVSPYQLNDAVKEMRELLGIKKPVAVRSQQRPVQTLLPAKKESSSSSPDSSVLSTTGSASCAYAPCLGDVENCKPASPEALIPGCSTIGCKQDRVDKTVSKPKCHTGDDAIHQARIMDKTVDKRVSEPEGEKGDAEHPDGIVENSETSTKAQPAPILGGGNINFDKIKELIRKRKAMSMCKGTLPRVDDDSELSWIEREVEAGIEMEMELSRKKMKLS